MKKPAFGIEAPAPSSCSLGAGSWKGAGLRWGLRAAPRLREVVAGGETARGQRRLRGGRGGPHRDGDDGDDEDERGSRAVLVRKITRYGAMLTRSWGTLVLGYIMSDYGDDG